MYNHIISYINALHCIALQWMVCINARMYVYTYKVHVCIYVYPLNTPKTTDIVYTDVYAHIEVSALRTRKADEL